MNPNTTNLKVKIDQNTKTGASIRPIINNMQVESYTLAA